MSDTLPYTAGGARLSELSLSAVQFKRRLVIALVAIGLVLAMLTAMTWWSAHNTEQASFEVAHAHQVQNTLAEMREASNRVWMGTQSYRIYHDPAILSERKAAAAVFEDAWRRAMRLTAGNPVQQEGLARLSDMMTERMAIPPEEIELLNETRQRMHSLLDDLETEERRLLDAREAYYELAQNIQLVVSALSLLALLGIVAGSSLLLHRQLRALAASRAALVDSEERLALTLRSIGDAVLVTDAAGFVTYLNPPAEHLTGWPLAEALGRPVAEVFRIVNEETRAPAVVPVAQVLASGRMQGLANHSLLIARDGVEWPIADSAAPIVDVGGNINGCVLVFRDVSIERRAERLLQTQNEVLEQLVGERTAALRDKEEHLRLIIDSVKDYAITTLDPAGRMRSWNPGAQHIKGYAAEEIIGQNFRVFFPATDIADDKPDRALTIAQRDGRYEEEGRRVRKDGAEFWASVVITPMRDAQGVLVGYVEVTRDITEKKRAEQAIVELNASLERRVA